MENLREIIALGRPHFLAGGFLLYTFGALLAILSGAEASSERFFLGYFVLFFGHLSVSYSNNYFDREADTGKKTLFSGGSQILQKKPQLAGLAKRFAVLLIATSMAAAVLLVWVFGFPMDFILLAAVGNILGWYYSAPPLSLSYRGLGELSTTAAFGLIMPGTGYSAMKGTIDGLFLTSSIPLLMYGFLFILSVEVPDREADKAAGKKTLITRTGTSFGYNTMAVMATAALFYFLLTDMALANLSMIPVAASLYALTTRRWEAAGYVTSSLIIFLLLADIYLLSTTGFYPSHLIP